MVQHAEKSLWGQYILIHGATGAKFTVASAWKGSIFMLYGTEVNINTARPHTITTNCDQQAIGGWK